MIQAMLSDWYELYINQPVSEEKIKTAVKNVKIQYFAWFIISTIIMLGGVISFFSSKGSGYQLEALLAVIIGFGLTNLMKTWAHIQLSKYRIMWLIINQSSETTEDELRKIKASDL